MSHNFDLINKPMMVKLDVLEVFETKMTTCLELMRQFSVV